VKKLILAAITTACAASAFAQGGVVFNNNVPGIISTRVFGPVAGNPTQLIVGNRPVDFPPGTTDYPGCLLIGTVGGLSASFTFASLLGAPGYNAPESSLLPASGGGITSFRTGGAPGTVFPTTAIFANIPGGEATLQMVAWDNASGLYPTWTQASVAWGAGLIVAGRCVPWNQDHMDGLTYMINSTDSSQHVQSFNLHMWIPEPTTLALAGLGAAALLMFRRRK
jgi:PEP-CTERM motif